ncbi:MAG: HAD family hydrolase [Candidatus Cloacimonadaceae bacterium]
MPNLKGLIFDLDGTLLYTLEDIANAENSALAELGLPALPVDEFRWIVGGGADNIAQKLLPADMQSEQDIITFVDRFRFYYHQNWHYKTRLYDGIADLIETLLQKGFKLAVLSNKPEEFAFKIVDFYFPDWQGQNKPAVFSHVIGQRINYPVKPDPTLALEIASDWNLRPEEIGFVGDSDIDMFTAKNSGMVAIGAAWGFRGEEELVLSGADIILKTSLDLLCYIK